MGIGLHSTITIELYRDEFGLEWAGIHCPISTKDAVIEMCKNLGYEVGKDVAYEENGYFMLDMHKI